MPHDFLIGTLDETVLLFRVRCVEGMFDLLSVNDLIRTLISVNDIGCSESTKVLENAPGSLGGACSLSGE